ncbi:hypothetical protein N9W34_02875 [Rickettsiales bacterium]|nr:hypothetical protein [Rickettsiales bacterium]
MTASLNKENKNTNSTKEASEIDIINQSSLFDKSNHTSYNVRQLWQSVLAQALLDATKNAYTPNQKLKRQKNAEWFSIENDDFLQVCCFAGVEPVDLIKQVSKPIIAARSNSNPSKKRRQIRRPLNIFIKQEPQSL